jgi:eukaryotic-like serine/threonine-protein kinase
MGIIYRARQISLNRLVALKMVLVGSHTPSSVLTRFRTEALAVARLHHPNIVQIFAIGEYEGRPFLALEVIEGPSLAEWLRHVPQKPHAAAALVETLALAMQAAHEQGVVHRDLKPGNILLQTTTSEPAKERAGIGDQPARWDAASAFEQSRAAAGSLVKRDEHDSGYGLPKIVDFGLAKLTDEVSAVTRTGDIMGTPAYVAPEQALAASRRKGVKRPAGAAADIYSLGAILYEILTGRPPFEGDTPIKVLLQVLHSDPISPSKLQPRVPGDLATICLKCLEKEASNRYITAWDLAEDLRRFCDGEPILAKRVGRIGTFWRRCKRRPVATALGTGLLMSLIGGFIATAVLWRHAERQRQQADESAESAESQLYFSRLVQAQLEWRLNNPAATYALLDQCVPQPGRPDRRGWEWYYLRNATHAEVSIFDSGAARHDDLGLSVLRFSQDGQQLVVGGAMLRRGGEVSFWDMRAWERGGAPVRARGIEEDAVTVRVLTVSRDARIVAYGGDDPPFKIWDTQTDKAPRALTGHRTGITSLSLSPDSTRLAAADKSGEATVSDTRTGEVLLRFPGAVVRFSADGKSLITCRGTERIPSSTIEVRSAADGRIERELPIEASRFEVSTDGTGLVVWKGADARVVDLVTGRLGASLNGHSGDIADAAFSPDGLHIATAAADRTVRLWDARSGVDELVFRGHLDRVKSVAFHPSGRYLASGDLKGMLVRIWDLTRHPEYLSIRGRPTLSRNSPTALNFPTVADLGFTSDGERLLEFRKDGSLREQDASGGSTTGPVRVISLTSDFVVPASLAAFSPDGRRLASVDERDLRRVNVWDNVTVLKTVQLQSTVRVLHVAWCRNGNRLVTAGVDQKGAQHVREVRVWDTATGKLLTDLHPRGSGALGTVRPYGVAALSADGSRVAFDDYTEGALPRVCICEVTGGRELFSLEVKEPEVNLLVFSSRGSLLAYGTREGRLRIYDLDAGRPLHTQSLQGPPNVTGMLAFSPDDRLIAQVDREQVQVWDARTGQPIILLRGAPVRRGDNAFNPRTGWSPDGRLLAASNHDNTIAIWDGSPELVRSDRRRLAEDRSFAWHLAHAECAIWKPELTAAAKFHLRALAYLEPPSEELRMERAILYAWLGRWREAASEATKAHAARPLALPDRLFAQALLRIQVDDTSGWQQVCAEMLERFGGTTQDSRAEYLARTIQLAPGGIRDRAEMFRWCEMPTDVHAKNLLLGGACYRTGELLEARRLLEHALQAAQPRPSVFAFLAMTYARLGQVEEARNVYDRLVRWLGDGEPSSTNKPLAVLSESKDWHTWLEAQILEREAKGVLQATEAAKAPR